jgi:hypothetical protein
MDTIVCPGCKLRVETIRVFEQSKKSKQWWRITKCPRERCGFNIDLAECDKPGSSKRLDDGNDGRSFWQNEL